MFKIRTEAGLQLAEKLLDNYDRDRVLIFAIPRGGLSLGTIMAKS